MGVSCGRGRGCLPAVWPFALLARAGTPGVWGSAPCTSVPVPARAPPGRFRGEACVLVPRGRAQMAPRTPGPGRRPLCGHLCPSTCAPAPRMAAPACPATRVPLMARWALPVGPVAGRPWGVGGCSAGAQGDRGGARRPRNRGGCSWAVARAARTRPRASPRRRRGPGSALPPVFPGPLWAWVPHASQGRSGHVGAPRPSAGQGRTRQ